MNSRTDSEATYCSEVEDLIKSTTKINKSSTILPIRRSQRQKKPSSNQQTSWNNIRIYSSGKVKQISESKRAPYLKKSLENKTELLKCTQNIFSTQDLREAQDSPLTNLTCNQQNLDTLIEEINNFGGCEEMSDIDAPLDLSKNSKRFKSTQKSNSVQVGIPKDDVLLDFSMKSKLCAQEPSAMHLKETKEKHEEKLQTNSEKFLNEYLIYMNSATTQETSAKEGFKEKLTNFNHTFSNGDQQLSPRSTVQETTPKVNITASIQETSETERFKDKLPNIVHTFSNGDQKLSPRSTVKEMTPEANISDVLQNPSSIKPYLNDNKSTEIMAGKTNQLTQPTNTNLLDVEHKQTYHKSNSNLIKSEDIENSLNITIDKPKKRKISTIKKERRGRPKKDMTTEKETAIKNIKLAGNHTNPNVMNIYKTSDELVNTIITPTQEFSNKSILPDVYPSHFKYQLPPEAVLHQPLFPQPAIMTPENTPSFEMLDSTSSSPSLPESLRGIFDTDDIKDLLNIEKVTYRLYDYHVQALAVILNLDVNYLKELIDKILRVNSNILKNVNKLMQMPFVEDRDLFAVTPESSPAVEDYVQNSQSPNNQRILSKQTKL